LVCSFEAAARTIGHLQRNVVLQGLPNVMLFNRAVYSKSGETLTFFEGPHHATDSLYSFSGATESAYKVKTVALDDFCEQSGLYPDVIKMDIEGAEYDALLGAERILDKVKPHLILELFPKIGMDCFNFLRAKGYVAIDSCNYATSQTPEEFQTGSGARNIIFIHETKLAATPYAFPIKRTLAKKIERKEIISTAMRAMSATVQLEPGRYSFCFDGQAQGKDNRMFAGIRQNGVILFYYISWSAHIINTHFEWMLDIVSSAPLSIAFEFQEGSDETFSMNEINIYRFDDIHMPLWSRMAMD
jgi:FkbM family methyltransferase